MAFIIEQAGGRAIDGSRRILDLLPTKIHERAPIFIGCKRDVDAIEKLFADAAGTGGEAREPEAKRARED